VLEGIRKVVRTLPNFSLADPSVQPYGANVIHIDYYTPCCKWLDRITVVMEDEKKDSGGSVARVRSYSTNFCPFPCGCCRIFRLLCGWQQIFGDGGENRKHTEDLSSALQSPFPHQMHIIYSS